MDYPQKVTWNNEWRYFVIQNRLHWIFILDTTLFDFFNTLHFLEKSGTWVEHSQGENLAGKFRQITPYITYNVLANGMEQEINLIPREILMYDRIPLTSIYAIKTEEQIQLLKEIMNKIFEIIYET